MNAATPQFANIGEGLDAAEDALANAKRLIADSRLLADNHRAHSAIILAVLGIEELGKSLIATWGVKNAASKRAYPTHVEKQAAVFVLLSTDELLMKNQKKLRRRIERGDFNLYDEGGYCEQLAWARKGFYDDLRMVATFSGQEPKIPKELFSGSALELSRELHAYYVSALLKKNKARVMNLAATIYANDLGRLRYRPGERPTPRLTSAANDHAQHPGAAPARRVEAAAYGH